METQKTQNSQYLLKEKDKVVGLTLPNFNTYYKTTVIKTVSETMFLSLLTLRVKL